eukprot:963506-Rhodomonas_salina.2
MQCNDGTNASQVKFAKQLELCSEFPQEREVLMPLNSHFRVRERIAQDEHARKLQHLRGRALRARTDLRVGRPRRLDRRARVGRAVLAGVRVACALRQGCCSTEAERAPGGGDRAACSGDGWEPKVELAWCVC